MSLADWFHRAFEDDKWGASVVGVAATVALQPKPRLATVRSAPSRDEFAAWRDDPTTRFIMAALARNAEECRDQWLSLSWDSGKADQRMLDGLRERSDALLGFTADYEAFCETLGLKPEAGDA
jgi:hypothetical protein